MGALRAHPALNIREWAGRRKQCPRGLEGPLSHSGLLIRFHVRRRLTLITEPGDEPAAPPYSQLLVDSEDQDGVSIPLGS